ncbi:MAG: hypothetical protein DMG61_05615 [Acidobacteria bacterium]|nr:MAG: hypothetical protein DMG61_05615 [Acidobacteriota bacterium]
MKNVRVSVVLLLLAVAAPFAVHYRAWSLDVRPKVSGAALQPSARHSSSFKPEGKLAQTNEINTTARSSADNSQPNASLALPAASSSLPLLSVIGFGIFLGGLISALRTRPAHK